jgi:hypothetical protein
MQVGRLEHGADAAAGPLEVGEAAAEDECVASGRFGQPEQHPQRGRLACAVRPEEAGDRPRLEVEGQIRHRCDLAEALRQSDGRDDRCHGASVADGGGKRIGRSPRP